MTDHAADPASRADALEASLRREQKKVALVQEVGRALSSGLELDQLLVLIMDKVTLLMEADRSTLYLATDDGRELWSKVVQGGEVFEIRLKVGEGVAGWVAHSGQVLNLPDAYADPRFQSAVDQRSGYRTRTMLCVPLKNPTGAITGVLQCLNKHGGPFTAADEELLEALASQAAVAIDNAKLYHRAIAQNAALTEARDQLAQRSRELNALYEVEKELSAALDLDGLLERILQQATHVLGAAAGSIALREPDGRTIRFRTVVGPAAEQLRNRTLPVGSGIIGWTIARRAPLIVNDPRADDRHAIELARDVGPPPRHLMAAPLIDNDEALGGIEILDKLDDDGFDAADLQVLVLIAGQVAKAIGVARSRSEQSNKDRLASIGRMLAGVLHDLKTPMTIISGYAQLMAHCEETPQREAYVEQILRQFDIMSGMTREVLAFARGDADIFIRKVYLHRFLEEVVQQLRHSLAGRGVELTMDARYDGTAFFDEQKLMRVIHNLARNAADAMPGGGKFRVTTGLEPDAAGSLDDGWVVFEIADDGPGIPAEVQSRLFELFATGKKGGTGLGLAIVKKIVDDHGGSITCDSGPAGTTFRIRLPRKRAAADVDAA
ncbi:MAG: GAF domain-containing sensor histidine kinase [Deltaproteobacteria bacterium]|nr:GAF domain-containing sensor histidine kinase [Deltaproteobacteria bacterium]